MESEAIQDVCRETFEAYDQNTAVINGVEYQIVAVFKDTAANMIHLIASRSTDLHLHHVVEVEVYGASKIERSTLLLFDYMNKEKRLQWLYTRDRVYHCFHICYCRTCRRSNGKIYTHSQANWDGHLRYQHADDMFTFPTVSTEAMTERKVHDQRVMKDSEAQDAR